MDFSINLEDTNILELLEGLDNEQWEINWDQGMEEFTKLKTELDINDLFKFDSEDYLVEPESSEQITLPPPLEPIQEIVEEITIPTVKVTPEVRQTTVLMGKKKKNKGKKKEVRRPVAKQTPLQTIDEEENLKMLADIATMTNEFQVEMGPQNNEETTTDITAMITQTQELIGKKFLTIGK